MHNRAPAGTTARGSVKASALLPACLGLMLAGLLGAGASAPALAQTIPSDAKSTCSVSSTTLNGWFQTGHVSLNGIVNPANSVTFPNTPNCSFYLWSQQMFLWLTSPAPSIYGGGARVFDAPVFYDVSPPNASGQRTLGRHVPGIFPVLLRSAQLGSHGLPIVVAKTGAMFEVLPPATAASGKPLVLNRERKSVEVERATIQNGKPVFFDAAGKQIAAPKPVIPRDLVGARVVQKMVIGGVPIFIDSAGNVVPTEQGQAGGGDVLMAQNGSLVYYTIEVNDVYAYFLTGTKDGGITPKPTQFPTTQAALNQIIAFAKAHGETFPDPNALAIELKMAWVEASSLPNPSSYITVQATIPTYSKTPAKWTQTGQTTATLALVGVHVVGSVAGHAEMIWASFEHFGNTPNAAYQYVSSSGVKAVPQSTAGSWLFCATGASSGFNASHMTFVSPDIVASAGFTVSPSNTLRMKPFGAASNASPNPIDPTAAQSNSEIIEVDHDVLSLLATGAAGDVRNNYFMFGATWTANGVAPSSNFGNPGNLTGVNVGTSQMNNTTMETYQQGAATFTANGSNCFFCHTVNPLTVGVSHIFGATQQLF